MSESRTPPASSARASRGRKVSRKPERPANAAVKPEGVKLVSLAPVDRTAMIAAAAYFRAERRRFAPGHELEDWVLAEREVDTVLLTGMPKQHPA